MNAPVDNPKLSDASLPVKYNVATAILMTNDHDYNNNKTPHVVRYKS